MNEQMETILKLKEARKERKLTYQNIVDMLDGDEHAISLSTIKKIFADGSENKTFRAETIKSLEKLLISNEDNDHSNQLESLLETFEKISLLQAEALRNITERNTNGNKI